MRVWLITTGEPLPVDGPHARLLRTGLLGNALVARGHEVVRWDSTFDHARKRHRFAEDSSVQLDERYTLRLLHSIGYPHNVSLRRWLNHRGVARAFARQAPSEPAPDVVLCSLPTVELCTAATAYAGKRSIPVVIDVRDMWPDIFLDLVPTWSRRLVRPVLAPTFGAARRALSNAAAVCGHAPGFVEWGLGLASRTRTRWDRDFPHGYTGKAPVAEALAEAKRAWEQSGLRQDGGAFIACFFGMMGKQFEIETVIEAARRLASGERRFRFVLCGAGSNLERYRGLAQGLDKVLFPGWVDAASIWSLMQMSAVGLAPYRSTRSFTLSIPNKSIEYLCAGLPVVSSLAGALEDLLAEHDCGLTCANGSPEALASILCNLYDDPQRREAMSKNARALYEARFVAEKVYAEMSEYLEEIAAAHDRGAARKGSEQ